MSVIVWAEVHCDACGVVIGHFQTANKQSARKQAREYGGVSSVDYDYCDKKCRKAHKVSKEMWE